MIKMKSCFGNDGGHHEIQNEIERLTKKYQDDIDILVKDYDEVIKASLIGIIANCRTNGTIRSDIIGSVDILIRIREFVVNQYSNCSGENN